MLGRLHMVSLVVYFAFPIAIVLRGYLLLDLVYCPGSRAVDVSPHYTHISIPHSLPVSFVIEFQLKAVAC
jgi:hypothetical protein